MNDSAEIKVAIVDYGMGNIFSIKHACHQGGMLASVTSSAPELLEADAVVLPGMGAFGDAMNALNALDLIAPLKEIASSGKPLIGICLGMQLLMTESYEFGRHRGLGIIEGPVVRFDKPAGESSARLKVPQVGWERIRRSTPADSGHKDPWQGTALEGLRDGEFMYFVHSFYVKPEKTENILSLSTYGGIEFCSSFNYRNIFACQFHPERSARAGLQIYRNIASLILEQDKGTEQIYV